MRDRNPSSFKAGCMADFDPGHYSFSRNSGLPRGYFNGNQTSIARLAELAMVVMFVCSLAALPFVL